MSTMALTLAREVEVLANTQTAETSAEFVERFAGDCDRFASEVIKLRRPGTAGMYAAARRLLVEIEKFEQRRRREDAETLRVPPRCVLEPEFAKITAAD